MRRQIDVDQFERIVGIAGAVLVGLLAVAVTAFGAYYTAVN